ncbi:hypothetical protein Mpt1_c08610 [Candidatus Methanoplasma termitum]|uniref:Resolvase/invertase-type recombinase catalytic domain-containing protein n=1 Tax=Candidatus Methanoplasma termitum TaxID=1577791 RepID=A0A0A7LEJ7_9ARCH|nr:recombinase family protein [Candidatus Methanoplasma termitum]AIZ56737.1 hypothetical protein Mpt1_c08610 [Candidatus Methanoplasma termitum]
MITRAALYVRVSVEEAEEGISTEAMMREMEEYCLTKENWEPVLRFTDEGYSGRDTDRPAYKAMMSLIDEWDVLLVMRMDRIHRNYDNHKEMMKVLEEKGKTLKSFEEEFDMESAVGRFVMDTIARSAQFEAEIEDEIKTYIDQNALMGTEEHKTRIIRIDLTRDGGGSFVMEPDENDEYHRVIDYL